MAYIGYWKRLSKALIPRLKDVLYLSVISLLHSKQVSSYSSMFAKINNSGRICASAWPNQLLILQPDIQKSANKQVIVIGAGFAGLASAALMAKNGCKVTLLEKNDQPGGRARVWEKEGFRFDMGPSWYWMPDIFENYFFLFGKKVSDFYELKRLDPGYRIYFGKGDNMDIPAGMDQLEALFESIEPGSTAALREFLAQAAYKYKIGMGEYVFKPFHSIFEYADLNLIKKSFNLQLLTNMSKHVRQYFKN